VFKVYGVHTHLISHQKVVVGTGFESSLVPAMACHLPVLDMSAAFPHLALGSTPSSSSWTELSLTAPGANTVIRSFRTDALDQDTLDSAGRIYAVERSIIALKCTMDALDAARKPLLFRRRREARRAAVAAQAAELAVQRADLWAAHVTMCRRRNARTSPLCALPLELVGRILELVTPFEHPQDRLVEWPDEYAGWERAMLVCAHLRAAALSSPALWAHIPFPCSKTWYELCMARAGTLPLSVSLVGSASTWIVRDIQRRARHIRDARLFLHHVGEDERELLTGWGPRLCSLVFWAHTNSWNPPVRVSQAWLGAALTELVLRSAELVTDGLRLPYLVRLELGDVRVEDGLPNLLRFIGAAAGLVLLCVDLTSVSGSTESSIADPISLPCLERSDLSGSHDDVRILIHALPVPADTYQITFCVTAAEEARAGLMTEVSSWRDGAVPVLWLGQDAAISTSGPPTIIIGGGARAASPARSFLTLTHPGTPDAPAVHCTGTFESTLLLAGALYAARALRLRAHCEASLVSAAADPLGPLGAVAHLALPDAWMPPVQDALRGWLCARAAAGRPVDTVDFLGASSLVYVEDLRALRVLAKEMLKKGWVHEVLHDGWTVSRETYVPADV
jgi:hypothetical protein